MHEIEKEKLWIGNALDLRSPEPIFDAGIRAVVDLAYEELPAQLPRQLASFRFPLNDGGGNDSKLIALAISTVHELLKSGMPVLVGCSAGMSRSPTIASFGLAAYLDMAAPDVLKKISEIRSLDINPEFWNEVVFAHIEMNVEDPPE